ncbi:MAG: hypothetical protein KME16_08610 [Scytolyngbya sp. HA4215-MV1]|nr:hypothetical protein [Scytolyngbya sp. HA4215-MV1]
MSDPDRLTDRDLSEGQQGSQSDAPGNRAASFVAVQGMPNTLTSSNGTSQPMASWEQERQVLLSELAQTQTLVQNRLTRICQLEQALDESLATFGELRLRVADQQLLESQLAATEEIANIQQQAIAQLKRQLAEQETALKAQGQTPQPRESSFSAYQIADLARQLLSAQTQINELEKQLNSAQREIQTLSTELERRQTSLTRLETELKQAYVALEEQQAIITHLQQTPLSTSPDEHSVLVTLNRELAIAQSRIEELTHHQINIGSQEQQKIAEMQEQILKQAKQASEYETAVQHWKNRCLASQSHATRLRELLSPILTKLLTEESSDASSVAEAEMLLAEILNLLQSPTTGTPTSLPSNTQTPHSPKVDLPDFLARRRRTYKAQ